SGGVSNDFVFIAIQKKTHQDGKILTLTPPPKSCKDSQPSKFFRWPKIIEGKTYRLIRGDRQTMFYYEAMNSVDENTKVTEGDTVKFREKDIEPPLSV
ncbi:hypothetical protein LWT84_24235, partial [Enterobacter hormaechei]|nr:hypothetical protein [Enterobacter hormaechei]